MNHLTDELDEIVGKFRAGEAEIAATFFAAKRPLEQHLHWLHFQTAREARNLEEIANHQRCKMVEDIEVSGSREDLIGQFLEDYQEIRHYAMLAYLYEALSGETVKWKAFRESAKQASWYELSRREHAKWAEFEEKGAKLELAAALFTRGGGGALFYGFIPLTGGDYERLLSQASKSILSDELEHGTSEGRDELYKVLKSEEDAEIAKGVIQEMCRIRLEMRNVQFSNVLPESRFNEISNGGIDPLTLNELLEACAGTGDWFQAFQQAPKPLSNSSIVS